MGGGERGGLGAEREEEGETNLVFNSKRVTNGICDLHVAYTIYNSFKCANFPNIFSIV